MVFGDSPITGIHLSAGNFKANSISQFGITWTFDKAYSIGKFVNGDFWILDPGDGVKIVAISPPTANLHGRIINGSMINPQGGNFQGYDSMINDYSEMLNVSASISTKDPLILNYNESLVSTISLINTTHTYLETAAVLTCLKDAPPKNSFRPGYSDPLKKLYSADDIDYTILGSLITVPDTPSFSTVEKYFEKPWIDHKADWSARRMHPLNNMPDYGREMATEIGIASLMLHLNYSVEQKKKLTIRLIQLGIDFYSISQNGGEFNWVPNGGHASGRKWPIIFAGLMLNNQSMKDIGSGDGTASIYFGEDAQTFYVTQDDIDMVHTPDTRNGPAEEYTSSDLDMPEWGIRHSTAPQYDNKAWSANYRTCCTATSWSGFVLSAYIMGAKELWDHDALFDYQDRYMQIETTYRCTSSFVEHMWDTYRVNY